MKRITSYFSLVFLCITVFVHFSAISGNPLQIKYPFIWSLHLISMISLVPVILECHKHLGSNPSFRQQWAGLKQIRHLFPNWVLLLGLAILIYVSINFIWFMIQQFSTGGTPKLIDGKYFLMSKQTVIREITEIDYESINANMLAGFSGHWIYFLFIAFAASSLRKND